MIDLVRYGDEIQATYLHRKEQSRDISRDPPRPKVSPKGKSAQ